MWAPKESFWETNSPAGGMSPHYNNLALLGCFCSFLHRHTDTCHFGVHRFFHSQGKKPIIWILIYISRKTQNKSWTSSRDLINGVFRKIQGPYIFTYESSEMMIEKTSHDTITDSSLWGSLHEIGPFLLQTSDMLKESLFFLLSFETNMIAMWWTGPEIFMF
jgi:hypothetical protein